MTSVVGVQSEGTYRGKDICFDFYWERGKPSPQTTLTIARVKENATSGFRCLVICQSLNRKCAYFKKNSENPENEVIN